MLPFRLLLLLLLLASPSARAQELVCQEGPHPFGAQPTKAALLVLFAHPDDEVDIAGSSLPFYGVARGMNTVGVCTANEDSNSFDLLRRDELRNAFWTFGLRNPPLFANFPDDCFGEPLDCSMESWGFESIVRALTEEIRRYRPEVIVTHDPLGGFARHPNHAITALAAAEAYDAAADASRFPEQVATHGTWQTKKLYGHLYRPDFIHPWTEPAPQLGGVSPQNRAAAGILCHETQNVELQTFRGRLFRLLRSEVGPDDGARDFFENLAPRIVAASADVQTGPIPLAVRFEAEAVAVGGGSLVYEWHFGDGETAVGPVVTHTYTSEGSYPARLTVWEGDVNSMSSPLPIEVGTPPVIQELWPPPGRTFRAGMPLVFYAVADDPNGTLPADAFQWDISFEDELGSLPLEPAPVGPIQVFTVPSRDVDFSGAGRYRLALTVTDSDGLRARSAVEVRPERVALRIESDPPGVRIDVDGEDVPTPVTGQALVGFEHDLEAPLEHCDRSSWTRYDFEGWEDGRTRSHTLTVPAEDVLLVAHYREAGACSSEVLSQDFAATAVGDDPPDWHDTAPWHGLIEADLYRMVPQGNEPAFGTAVSVDDVHSHWTGPEAADLRDFQYSGYLRVEDAAAGIGVTFLSRYPEEDAYYALTRSPNSSFRLVARGTTLLGDVETGVVPAAGQWYGFRIEAISGAASTSVRARVWRSDLPEPSAWQADASDTGAARLRKGRIGLWAAGTGTKSWDDLLVDAPAWMAACSQGPDLDGDGAPDACDNCTAQANAVSTPDAGGRVQWDRDGDGFGNVCDADFTQDGFVGGPDFAVLLACLNEAVAPGVGPPDDPDCGESDMSGDGFVGGPDFDLFLQGFDAPPGPAGG